VFVSWGQSNRSALIRIPMYKPRKGASTRIEYRAPDPACNPYLAFALILAAGLKGIEEGYELPDESEDNTFELTPAERAANGIERLPPASARRSRSWRAPSWWPRPSVSTCSLLPRQQASGVGRVLGPRDAVRARPLPAAAVSAGRPWRPAAASLRARLAKAGLDPDQALPSCAGRPRSTTIPASTVDLLEVSPRPPTPGTPCCASTDARRPTTRTSSRGPRRRAWLQRVVAVGGASRPLGDLLARHPDASSGPAHPRRGRRRPTADAEVAEAVLASDARREQAAGIAAIRRRRPRTSPRRDLTGVADVAEVAASSPTAGRGVLTGTLPGSTAGRAGGPGRPHRRDRDGQARRPGAQLRLGRRRRVRPRTDRRRRRRRGAARPGRCSRGCSSC
jgi:hypothetical protein